MSASAKLKLKSVPAVVVFDADRTMQYARAVDSEQWLTHLKMAVVRIARGDAIGQEMRAEYERYLDEYHDRLLAANEDAAMDMASARKVLEGEKKAELVWEVDALREPGNAHIPEGSDQILVLDGWQTVVALNRAGQIEETHSLPLPAGSAINRIRSWRTRDNRLIFVLFGLLGKQAYVFDDRWNLLLEYPHRDQSQDHRGITECQLADHDRDGKAELWISFLDQQGLQQVDLSDGKATQIATAPTRSFCLARSVLFRVEDTSLICSQPHFDLQPFKGWHISIVRHVPEQVFAIARNEANQWRLFGIRLSDGSIWSKPIDSQLFETEIDPIAVAIVGVGCIVAVASPRRVALLSENARPWGDFWLSSHRVGALTGMSVLGREGQLSLLMCADNKIRFWNLASAAEGSSHSISHAADAENARARACLWSNGR